MKKLFSIFALVICFSFTSTSFGQSPPDEDKKETITFDGVDYELTASTDFESIELIELDTTIILGGETYTICLGVYEGESLFENSGMLKTNEENLILENLNSHNRQIDKYKDKNILSDLKTTEKDAIVLKPPLLYSSPQNLVLN